ncbi:MAG: hypothetical protein IJ061_06420 [Lachnospiraceae bacterium]|nr:hypothetical protein [Lachnospiraceae bacterium]
MTGYRYQWMVEEWEEMQRENARRIERSLRGRMCPSRAEIVRALNKSAQLYQATKGGSIEK